MKEFIFELSWGRIRLLRQDGFLFPYISRFNKAFCLSNFFYLVKTALLTEVLSSLYSDDFVFVDFTSPPVAFEDSDYFDIYELLSLMDKKGVLWCLVAHKNTPLLLKTFEDIAILWERHDSQVIITNYPQEHFLPRSK